jgi:MFS family permease
MAAPLTATDRVAPLKARRSRSAGAFSEPNFRTYVASAALSQCGSWLLRTTQAWLVLDLTGSPAALGLVTFAQALPVTIFTLFAGVLIDRASTRPLLVAVQAVFGIQAAILAVLVLTHQVQLWQVVLLATLLGLASAVDFPTRSAIVSELLEPPLVANGVAINSALSSAARIIGPGLGGLIIAVWGSGVCFAVVAVTYVLATVGLMLLRRERFQPKRVAPSRSVLRQLTQGLRYSFSTPTLAANMLLAAFYGTFAYNWAMVLPLMARFALDSGAEGFGALNMAMGVGSTIAAFALATRLKASLKLLWIAAAVFGGCMLMVAHATSMPMAIVMLVVTGILSVLFNATNNTLLQVEAREDFRGRVLALYMFLMIGSTPFGSAVTGFMADKFDVRVALQMNATVCLIGLVVTAIYYRRARHPKPVYPAIASEADA